MTAQDKIKFSTKENNDFFLELKEKVSNYFTSNNISKNGNLNLVLKSIFMFSLYLAPYFLMLLGVISSIEGILLCWILMGLGKSGVGMTIMHDANHQAFSKNKIINTWLGKSMYLVGGFPLNWQYQHNTMHHTFTNIDGRDEDIDPGSILRFSPHKPLKKHHKYQHLYAWFLYGLMTISWITDKDFAQLKRYKETGAKLNTKKSYKQLLINLTISKVLYYIVFLIIPLIVLPIAWYWTILFFISMHFTAGFLLTVIFQTAHVVPTTDFPLPDENGIMDNNWAIHQLHTTSDFSPKNRILSWFIGGLNYQIEHHLFPNISHVHYRKISNMVKTTAMKYGLPYHVQTRFLKAVFEHGRMLKKLGRA